MISVYFDDDVLKALEHIRERDGLPAAELIRRAVRAALEERGELKTERPRAGTRKRS
jgi:metal-responsive CopG/Arc/MetJ family transcriptional regulator